MCQCIHCRQVLWVCICESATQLCSREIGLCATADLRLRPNQSRSLVVVATSSMKECLTRQHYGREVDKAARQKTVDRQHGNRQALGCGWQDCCQSNAEVSFSIVSLPLKGSLSSCPSLSSMWSTSASNNCTSQSAVRRPMIQWVAVVHPSLSQTMRSQNTLCTLQERTFHVHN